MKKTISFIIISFLLWPFFALADGVFFPPPDYYMYETDQRAVIFYEGGFETLVLSATFRGDAKDFGWVVPTPSRPDVSRSSDELFTSLEELTRVEYGYPAPMSVEENYSLGQKDASVYVVETKKIEYYDITVLLANDSQALAKWLAKNNYQFPQNASYILDSYINNQWYFTAVKIDTSAIAPSVSRQLREGHMVPLQLKFSTEKIVFPLKISSIMEEYFKPRFYEQQIMSQDIGDVDGGQTRGLIYPELAPIYYYPQQVGILLYVFTPDNKQTLPGFATQYAGWVKQDTIKNLAYYENGNSWISPSKDKYYLTKLTRWMSPSEMSSDLYLRNAPDNDLVNAEPLPEDTNNFWFWFAMAASLTLTLGTGITIFVLSKK